MSITAPDTLTRDKFDAIPTERLFDVRSFAELNHQGHALRARNENALKRRIAERGKLSKATS